MDKKQIVKIIDDRIMEQQLDPNSLSISSHTHNGSDSPQIQSSNVNTLNGFTFGTATNNVKIFYDVSSGKFVILEGATPSLVPLIIGSFKNIGIVADGLSGSDNILIAFNNAPKSAILSLDATTAFLSYTNGIGTNLSSISLTSGNFNLRTNNGTSASNIVFQPNLMDISATAGQPFAIWLPNNNTLPAPQTGMIAYDGTNFRGVDSSGIWKTFTLV